jgi:FkbM family methyltransferase
VARTSGSARGLDVVGRDSVSRLADGEVDCGDRPKIGDGLRVGAEAACPRSRSSWRVVSRAMSKLSGEELYNRLEARYFGPQMDEAREIRALPKILKDVSIFVDVGASLGQYTYAASQLMRNGIIYSIEADPFRFQRLNELCKRWADSPRNNRIVPLNIALSDEIGTTKFFVTDADRSGSLLPHQEHQDAEGPNEWQEIIVNTATLDSLFPSESVPDFVKIDVEGMEYRVLLGSRKLLRVGKSRFMIEVHRWGDPTIGKRESDVFDILAEFSYDFKRVHHHWLFSKSESSIRLRVKNRTLHLILDHPAVRENVRRLFGKR